MASHPCPDHDTDSEILSYISHSVNAKLKTVGSGILKNETLKHELS